MNEYRPPLSYRVRQAVDHCARRLADFFGLLITPIEGAFRRLSRLFLMGSESLEHIDSALLGLVRLITWPFRMMGRLAAALADWLVPGWLRGAVAAPFVHAAAAWRRVRSGVWILLERLNLDAPVMALAWVTQPLWRPVAAVIGLLYAWAVTRTYRRFLWALPAVVLFLPVLGVSLWGVFGSSEGVADHYRAAVAAARDEQDFARMQMFERKLAQLGVDTDRTNYQTAAALGDEGKLDEAYERMKELAPESEPKYFPAHNWIFARLINKELDVPEEDRVRIAGIHLEHMKSLGGRGDDFDLLCGIWLRQNGQLEEAAESLKPLIARVRFAAILRMEVDLLLNRVDEATRDARAVRDHVRDLKRRGAEISAQDYASWAKATELLGNDGELAEVLREWLAAFPDDPLARENVVALDLREFHQILRSPLAIPDELAKRLEEVARLSTDRNVLEPLVASLYQMQDQSTAIAELIEQLIHLQNPPLPLAAALGTSAAVNNDILPARELLGRVVSAEPGNAVAWNNYAWTLSRPPDAELEEALNAVNRALELAPTEFRFRETRGQILMGLGRWEPAIDDLEYALNGMPDSSEIHLSLAKAYDELGNHALADMHRSQVQ